MAVDQVTTIIQPPTTWANTDWGAVWKARELLFFLTWRDIKVRYKQTLLGVAWALLQPVLNTVVFTLFFGRLAGLDARTGGIPYPLYVLAGLVPWMFFANSLTSSASSLVSSANLIGKVYFPRLVIPFSAAASALLDLLLSFGALVPLMIWYGLRPSPQLFLLPPLILCMFTLVAGVGAGLAAVNLEYRDVRHVVPFAVQILMFVSGVIYPSNIVPLKWRTLYYLNPLAGLIEGFRAALLGGVIEWKALALGGLMSMLLFLVGTAYFSASERRFADIA